ncbi:MAG: hypothetical protein LBD02_02170 [Christensenellaceae bacterium]|jgi:hypothetical protein|nr:hypothetical protein [Christensenellaceae bacterium]
MKKTVLTGAILFCAIFGAATLISSGIQLANGIESDSNFHILLRGFVSLIGVMAFWASWKADFKLKAMNGILP